MNFRRRIRVFPGFTVNLSKSGMSATVGIRGASVNVSRSGSYLNTGIPGTGLYSRTKIWDRERAPAPTPADSRPFGTALPEPDTGVEIKSFHPSLITSENLFGLRESVVKAQETKRELAQESATALAAKRRWLLVVVATHILVVGIFIKAIRERFRQLSQEAKRAREAFEDFQMEVSFAFDKELLNEYAELCDAFDRVSSVQRIWDVVSTRRVDKVRERSSASKAVTRTPVSFTRSQLDFLRCEQQTLHLKNANGADLHLYPGFLAVVSSSGQFGFVDMREVKVAHHSVRFIEQDGVPADTRVVDKTWRYVNKNGTRDRRYNDNYEIPIAEYHEFYLRSDSGLNEGYMFSDPDAGATFCSKLVAYQNTLSKLRWEASPEQTSGIAT